MTWWAAGAAVVGGVLQSNASNRAARSQQDAAAAAAAEQRRQFDLAREDQTLWREAGGNAVRQLSQFGDYNPTPSAADVMATPGYEFGRSEGQRNLQSTAASRGGLYGGQTLRDLTRFNNDYATTKYGEAANRAETNFSNRANRLQALAGLGQSSVSQTGQLGAGAGARIGEYYAGAGNAAAGNAISQGNIWGNALNGIAYGARRGGQNQGSPYNYDMGSNGSGGYYSNEGNNYPTPMADGGPVVRVRTPQVGTVEPLPEGTGGGLSREAILQVLRANAANATDAAPAKTGMAALPTDPLRNPGGVRKAQMAAQGLKDGGQPSMHSMMMERRKYMQGGPAKGPGGPRADAIPAMLSNGEHVMDAASVTALGGGNNAMGQQKLNAFRSMLKAHHAN